MKVSYSILFFVVLTCFFSCIEVEDEGKVLSFWTDRSLQDTALMLLINDVYLDDFKIPLENPSCMDSSLINFVMKDSEDLFISVVDDADTIFIGMVNLYSISQGIKIKESDRGEIFVDRPLDADCTLVYINWD